MFEVSKVKCLICTKEWVAVRPLLTVILECPNCEIMTKVENINIEE